MSSLSLANLTLHARLLAQDTSTSSPALQDSQYYSLINEKYAWYKEVVDPRTTWVNHTQLTGSGGGVSSKSFKTSDTNYRKILALLPETSSSSTDLASPLERVELNELGDFSTSSYYALSRQQLTSTAADNGKWTIYFGAAPATQFYSAWVIKEVTALSSGSDVPELSDHEGYMVARMAAAEAARLAGRTEMVDQILAPLPQEVRDALQTAQNVKKPRGRLMEDAF